MEKLATTEPLTTAAPQSSLSCVIKVAGHPAGTVKLFTMPVSVIASLAGVHPGEVTCERTPAVVAVPGRTTNVTFTLASVPDMDTFTLPV